MTKALKASNAHKAHPTTCATCGRTLPRRAFKRDCATCIKWLRGKPHTGGDWLWSLTPAERAETIAAANEHRASIGLPLIGRKARREAARAERARQTTAGVA